VQISLHHAWKFATHGFRFFTDRVSGAFPTDEVKAHLA